jgi:ribonucleoside-diphosphate reductase alpha chain
MNEGSIQNIDEIPDAIKVIFKTAFEISMRTVIDLASDRGAYICQSQSMNLFYDKPNFGKFSSALMYAWKKGLKTGSYYIRTKPAIQAQKITIDFDIINKQKEAVACSLNNPETCEVCSS